MSTTPEPETRCPQCRGTRFSIEWLLVARPDGSYSLAGATRKISAVNTPILVCDDCGATVKGRRSA
jgi:hypothetical protein